MNSKEKILILDVMQYEDKKTGEIKSRIGFVLCDDKHFKATEKFVGFSELSCFYNDSIVNKVPKELILEPVDGIFQLSPSSTNPLRTTSILTGIEYKGRVYKFL